MGSIPSMAEVLKSLQTQIAYHRGQEAFHGERAAFHGAQQASHAARLEELTRHLAAFETAVSAATDLVAREILASAASCPQGSE